jgi:NADH:ubiquinone oxidoreductase subunit H
MTLAMKLRSLSALLLLAGCGSSQPEPQIRDLRPLQIERDDKVTIEANGPLFTVGAATMVSFDRIQYQKGVPLSVVGRAVSPTRVLFDADKHLEDILRQHGGHLIAHTTVHVEQMVGGEKRVFASSPSDMFEVDLFPRSLHHVGQLYADKVGGGALWDWLGARVEAVQGGVQVREVVAKFDKDDFFRRYDTPPLDGKISIDEAKVGWPSGMPADEFRRLDADGDRMIESYEVEGEPDQDGLAATAGLKAYDVITAANGRAVASLEELNKAWSDDVSSVTLTVSRQGMSPPGATITLPRYGAPMEIPGWLIFALCMAVAAGLIALPVPVIGGLIVVWERKISAYMQSRIGPNRVGPGGWLQWLADGLKLIMKEDLIPKEADPILFRASPYLAFVGLFLVFMVLPFTQWVIVADLNIGLLFLLSVTSLVVVSIIMGGWSSNSKWSLLGGMRSAAQIISYELPASVALLTIATLTGSLSTEAIVRAQGGAPWNWYMFQNPFTYVAFFIYFISALAEGNRTPFDLPEAESELVSGYNTEYSGFRFSLFPLVEWVNLFVIGAVASMLFCGGWRVPLLGLAAQDAHWYWQLLGFGVFLLKILAFIFVIIWIRWTLPRFRVDQMMNLCWKFFIPISFACFVGVLGYVWLVPHWAQLAVRFATFAVGGLVPLYYFFRKVRYNRSRYQELNLNPLL